MGDWLDDIGLTKSLGKTEVMEFGISLERTFVKVLNWTNRSIGEIRISVCGILGEQCPLKSKNVELILKRLEMSTSPRLHPHLIVLPQEYECIVIKHFRPNLFFLNDLKPFIFFWYR